MAEHSLIQFPRLDLADLQFDTALTTLWDMLQHEDGTPMSVEANALLTALHKQHELTEAALNLASDQLIATTEAARELVFQRDQALETLRSFRNSAAEYVRQQQDRQLGDIRIEHDLDDNRAAAAVLAALAGNNDAVSAFLLNDLRDIVQQIIADLRENGDL